MSGQSPIKSDIASFKEIISSLNTPLKKSSNMYQEKNMQQNFDNSGQHNRSIPLLSSRPNLDNCNSIALNLPSVFFSPSTNLINSSPNSIEKWFETYSREKINVLKLIKCNHDVKNKLKSKENSRHSSAKTPKIIQISNNLKFAKSEEKNNEKNFSEDFFAKKNLMKLFDNNNFNSVSENGELEISLLNNKTERIQTDEFSDEDCLKLNGDRLSQRNIPEILNSPIRKPSMDSLLNFHGLKTESRFSSTSKKKQIFFCSEQKSIYTSGIKSSCPTLTSSEKKERRRLRKTTMQLKILHSTYQENFSKDWNKEMICEIANRIGLKETKVYKWLWDKKNKEMSEKKVFLIQSGSKIDR